MLFWLAATHSVALFQCWRTALQQKLRGTLPLNAAAMVRYVHGVPPSLGLMGALGGLRNLAASAAMPTAPSEADIQRLSS